MNDKKDKIANHITDVMMRGERGKDPDFERWMIDNEFAPEVMRRLSDYETLVENNRQFALDEQEKERESQLLLKKINHYNRKKLFVKLSSIAAVLIIIFVAVWGLNAPTETKNEIVVSKSEDAPIEIPTIIVENGEVLYLKNQEKAVISNNSITQQNGSAISVKDSMTYSNLIVPKQSTYTIELSDGTIVRMNANSKLRFPNQFNGSTREVFMEGEAFFEVAKDKKKPFIVTYKNTKIEVLGTQFNVNTYSENIVKTFLVEGSVGVSYHKNRIVMLPNQLSIVNEMTNSNTILDITINDRENIVGWLNDIFIFNNVEVREIVKILSTWYGKELVVDDRMNESVTARYKRNTPLEEILKSLEIITGKQILK